MKNRRLAAAGVAIGLMGGAAAGAALTVPGISNAQTPTSTTPAPDATRDSKLRSTLQPLIDNGTLTQAQVDAVVGALEQAAPPAHRPAHPAGSVGGDLATAASTIGVSEDDLRTAVQNGQSIADVAKSKGVDPQAVIDALVAKMKERLSAAVSAGNLAQADADRLAADAQTRITDMVNGVFAPHGPFGHRPRPASGTTNATN